MKNNSISHEQVTQSISYTTQEGNHLARVEPKARDPEKSQQHVEVVDVTNLLYIYIYIYSLLL